MTLLKRTAKRSRLLINYFQIDVSPPCGFLWKFAAKEKVNDILTRDEYWHRSKIPFSIHKPQWHQRIIWNTTKTRFGGLRKSVWPCVLLTPKEQDRLDSNRETGNYHLLYKCYLLGSQGKNKCQMNIMAVL